MLPQILHNRNQRLIFDTETQLLVIKQLILFHRLQFNTLKLESWRVFLMFGEERIEIHPSITILFRATDLILAQEEVHVDLLFALLHLSSDTVHWLIKDLEDVDCPVDVHDFASHSNHHGSQEDPRLFFHFGTHHKRSHEVNLFELDRFFRRCSFASARHVARTTFFGYDQVS